MSLTALPACVLMWCEEVSLEEFFSAAPKWSEKSVIAGLKIPLQTCFKANKNTCLNYYSYLMFFSQKVQLPSLKFLENVLKCLKTTFIPFASLKSSESMTMEIV